MGRQIDLGLEIPTPEVVVEDVDQVIAELSRTCLACGLGSLHPDNPGLIFRGNQYGWLAFLSEMPGPVEWKTKKAMSGPTGRLLDKWCTNVLGIDSNKESLIINVVQCPTPFTVPKGKNQRGKQRSPDKKEILKCTPRWMRVLRAMPNLTCLVTLGAVATETLFGVDPLETVFTGNWFRMTKLPGVAVYVLPHPAALLHDPSEERLKYVNKLLGQFKVEHQRKIEIVQKEKYACPSTS